MLPDGEQAPSILHVRTERQAAMTAPTAADRLQEVFRAVFEMPERADVKHLRQLNTPTWDSLAHVSLVTAIESEFGVTLEATDQLRMTSYAATAALLAEKVP